MHSGCPCFRSTRLLHNPCMSGGLPQKEQSGASGSSDSPTASGNGSHPVTFEPLRQSHAGEDQLHPLQRPLCSGHGSVRTVSWGWKNRRSSKQLFEIARSTLPQWTKNSLRSSAFSLLSVGNGV